MSRQTRGQQLQRELDDVLARWDSLIGERELMELVVEWSDSARMRLRELEAEEEETAAHDDE